MTKLDLLLIRQREHEICVVELILQRVKLEGATKEYASRFESERDVLEQTRASHIKYLESKGHDYLTITAEMARIRAEVRGEK